METTEQPVENKQLTVEELNIEILPTIYEIIRRLVFHPIFQISCSVYHVRVIYRSDIAYITDIFIFYIFQY